MLDDLIALLMIVVLAGVVWQGIGATPTETALALLVASAIGVCLVARAVVRRLRRKQAGRAPQ